MHWAGAPAASILQQLLVGLLAAAAVIVWSQLREQGSSRHGARWPLLVLAACLWLPLIDGASHSPSRWVGLFGFRLYVAPVVVPTLLLLSLRSVSSPGSSSASALLAVGAAAAALVVQPDAPQLVAFTLGCIPFLWVSRLSRGIKVSAVVSLGAAASVAWSIPVPLEPVPYVEGVFAVAAQHSLAAWLLSVVLAGLPCAALARLASAEGSPELLGPAVYFTALLLLAPLQATPVPLLGFGAGPVLGYCLLGASTRSAMPTGKAPGRSPMSR